MTTITAVYGDITTQQVDAIVNAANSAMRGGGGVDGAIHRGGGPAVLRDCIERFPEGLATGDAGWTTAGDLPAQWVIHAVGPNYRAGQRDRTLLQSCYRRALEVADELGARSVAFPLISSGIYGWPRDDAIAVAIDAIAGAGNQVDDVRVVAFDDATHNIVRAELVAGTRIRILQGVRTLHARGYHQVRARPGMSPSGLFWRVNITTGDKFHEAGYSDSAGSDFCGAHVTAATDPDQVADVILAMLPEVQPTADDPEYVAWFDGLLRLVESTGRSPVSYADYFDGRQGWEIGWGSGIRYPWPPSLPADRG